MSSIRNTWIDIYPITLRVLLFISSTTALSQVNVEGYYRKDGTYVRAHTRSMPTYNNSSTSAINHLRDYLRSRPNCYHAQCSAIAISTGMRCKHCVSAPWDRFCYQHPIFKIKEDQNRFDELVRYNPQLRVTQISLGFNLLNNRGGSISAFLNTASIVDFVVFIDFSRNEEDFNLIRSDASFGGLKLYDYRTYGGLNLGLSSPEVFRLSMFSSIGIYRHNTRNVYSYQGDYNFLDYNVQNARVNLGVRSGIRLRLTKNFGAQGFYDSFLKSSGAGASINF
jgi:hypothetical protein